MCRNAILASLSAAILSASHASAIELITPSEAALPDPPPFTTRAGVTRGPTIRIEAPPQNVKIAAPFLLRLRFEARGGSSIDRNAISFIYEKLPVVDLTPRIREYVGNSEVLIHETIVPPGQHRIRVEVSDTLGRRSYTTLNLNVARP